MELEQSKMTLYTQDVVEERQLEVEEERERILFIRSEKRQSWKDYGKSVLMNND